jgi:hypothetical protein
MASVPFNNLITFSRGSNATLTGSNGLIQYAPNNLLTFSEQFDNAGWNKTAVTVTANTTAAPDGTSTADAVFDTTANSLHYVQQAPTLTAGQTIVISFYAKANTLSRVLVRENSVTGFSVSFDLSSGTILATNGSVTGSITSVGNGWYRCAMVQGIGTTGVTGYGIFTLPAGGSTFANATYVGTGQSVYLWGAQLELGSAATTYNSTTVKNLLGFSEAFDNAAWVKTNASIVTGAQANPVNGAFNAQKLMENTANGQHQTYGSSTTVSGGIYTFSVYVKAAGRSFFSLYPQSGTAASAVFNLNTGTSANGSDTTNLISHSIQNVGSGWYRCSITFATTGTSVLSVLYLRDSAGAATAPLYTGDGSSGVYIYGAQLSDSASLDPYVPTPAAAPSSTAYYGPRFDYDPVTLAPKGILIEEQRTNLVLQTSDFTAASWAAAVSGTSTRTNNGTALGFMSATVTATSADGGIRQVLTGLTAAQVYTLSFYIQSAATSVRVRLENSISTYGAFITVIINPSNGTASAPSGFTSVTATPFGAGYLYKLTLPAAGGTLIANLEWIITASGDTMQLGMPQFEAGAFATSYIPTVASTVTRSADVATINGSLFSQWYAQTQGTFVFEGDSVTTTGIPYAVLASDGGFSNRFGLYRSDNYGVGLITNSGVTQLQIFSAPSIVANVPFKMAVAAQTNNGNFSFNGSIGTNDTSITMPAVNRLSLASGPSGGADQLNGHIRSINFIPARAADFQLQVLST